MKKRIMVVAGEASSEMYGALLSRALKDLWPDIEIFGMGGSRMQGQGVRLITPMSSSHGLVEALHLLGTLKRSFDCLVAALGEEKPNVLVLIDYPDFNIPLAKKAKTLGVPVLYYVSPTVWAWRRGRAQKIARRVDAVALIFPFELDIYQPLDVECEFVGHPVLDFHAQSCPPGALSVAEARTSLGIDLQKTTLALMPGSRKGEIEKLLPLLMDASNTLRKYQPDLQFILPLAPDVELDVKGHDIKTFRGRVGEILTASDGAVIASGTAALEAMFFNTPLVMIYRLSPLTYHLARLLLQVNYISHVNMIEDREVVPELLQHKASVANIITYAQKILWDKDYREDMKMVFERVSRLFGGSGASLKVAQMVGRLAGW
jgi:lipid-A-disaccharide synthase